MLELIKSDVGRNHRGDILGLYRCSCGVEKIIKNTSVRQGVSRSCGCLQKQAAIKSSHCMHNANTKHSMSYSREYSSWQAMKTRCTNTKHDNYPLYGGRGIRYCSEWEIFDNFYKDMGNRPKETTLDRINPSDNYYKDNCRWADKFVQANNKRKRRKANEELFI